MIVRIMGEGQLDVPDSEVDELNRLDSAVEAAVHSGDNAGFHQALAALLERVRTVGQPVADDALVTSEAILPSPDSHLDDVAGWLGEEGLIPG